MFRWQEWDWNLTFSEFSQAILRIADLKLANSQVLKGYSAIFAWFPSHKILGESDSDAIGLVHEDATVQGIFSNEGAADRGSGCGLGFVL
jgi:hypothetical protein